MSVVSATTDHQLSLNQKKHSVDNHTDSNNKGLIHLGEGEHKHRKQAHAHRVGDDQEESPTEKWTDEVGEIVLGEPGICSQAHRLCYNH